MITFDEIASGTSEVAVVGLGYVGLPLAVALSDHFKVIGFDISRHRIQELRSGQDSTREVEPDRLNRARIEYTDDPAQLARAGIIVVAVPTPIDGNRKPDLRPVVGATATVGSHMRAGCIVVYESTVYPGLTEEICVPLLEEKSGLTCGADFTVGYSPERINPGDKVHTLESIVKVVAGQDQPTADLLARFYGSVVKAGVHRASSIKVAEAAKVIENTQRDLNIALMNELALIFDRMDIDTAEVLQAAGTKWNFLPFRPGLVGGHCIGVDPYYLTHKAQSIGLHPEIILAARRLNDRMGEYVATQLIKEMVKQRIQVVGARILILGLSFKENCPDIRNTKIVDMVKALKEYDLDLDIYDPWVSPQEVEHEYGFAPLLTLEQHQYDAIVIAVAHDQFKQMSVNDFEKLGKAQHVLYDLKYILDQEYSDIRL